MVQNDGSVEILRSLGIVGNDRLEIEISPCGQNDRIKSEILN
jgi:hypothetical protein